MSEIIEKTIEEFNITVPWGHIAVKAWGSKKDPHVIMVHGTGDNAGTYDNLLPLLPNSFYYICIDLPGHGKSSYLPPHLPIHATDYLLIIKLILDSFEKQKFIYIGHSLGCQIGSLFAMVYPEYIDKMILLDAVGFFPVEVNKFKNYVRKRIDKIIDLMESSPIKEGVAYEYKDLMEKFRHNRYQQEILKEEAAEPMLRRALKQTDDGKYMLTTDERMMVCFEPLHDAKYIVSILKNCGFKGPILIIFAKSDVHPRNRHKQVLKYLLNLKNVKTVYVDGQHDVHNNNPSVVASYINKFLINQKSKM